VLVVGHVGHRNLQYFFTDDSVCFFAGRPQSFKPLRLRTMASARRPGAGRAGRRFRCTSSCIPEGVIFVEKFIGKPTR